MFRYDVGGVLEYLKSYASVGCRILSMAINSNFNNIYIGCSDGIIRIIDKNTGKQMNHITGNLTRGLNSYIWSLVVLSDNTIISGDNRGTVQVWDGTTCVLIQSIHQHTAEVLTLAVSPDENNVYATGVDSRVICIRRINNAFGGNSNSPADSQWLYSSAHRPHSHDVNTLAVCHTSVTSYVTPKNTKNNTGTGTASEKTVVDAYVLLSGGIDTKLCLYSISEFHMTRPQWILPIPPTGIVHTSQSEENTKTIAVQHSSHIDIWRANIVKPTVSAVEERSSKKSKRNEEDSEEAPNYYGSTPKKADTGTATPKKSEKKAKKEALAAVESSTSTSTSVLPYGDDLSDNCSIVSKIICNNGDYIYTSALSACGRYVAFSKSTHTRLYHINTDSNTSTSTLVSIPLPDSISNNMCYDISFNNTTTTTKSTTTSSSILMSCVTTRGSLFLLSIAPDSTSGFNVVIDHCVNHFSHVGNTLNYLVKQNNKQELGTEHLKHPLLYTVNKLLIGECSNYIVVSDSTSYLYVYGAQKRMKLHWAILPSMTIGSGSDMCITNIEFYNESAHVLMVLLSNNSMVFINMLEKKVVPTPWSGAVVGTSITNSANNAIATGCSTSPSTGYLPNELLNYPSSLTGVSLHKSMMVLYGSGCIVVINIPTNTTNTVTG